MASKERVFLYTQQGVNEDLTQAARSEFQRRGIPIEEIDLSGFKLDEEWPVLPVISGRIGFIGTFRNAQVIKDWISLINLPEPQT